RRTRRHLPRSLCVLRAPTRRAVDGRHVVFGVQPIGTPPVPPPSTSGSALLQRDDALRGRGADLDGAPGRPWLRLVRRRVCRADRPGERGCPPSPVAVPLVSACRRPPTARRERPDLSAGSRRGSRRLAGAGLAGQRRGITRRAPAVG